MKKKAARKSTILELLSERGSLSLAGLAEELDVSLSTIRRDLDELEAQRLVRRSFGAAEIASSNEEFAFTLRATLNQDQKQRIACQALNLIANGDSIYISSGSTTLEFARLLPGKFRLTVITNAMRVANCLLDCA